MKVSIITVCLNSEKHIEQTIKSVLNQTYKEIEYIIVDGMSTDNTLNIIQKYKPLFNGRLKVISEKDSGIYDAMNKGIKISTGDIIGIINSDDWYEVDAIENVMKQYILDCNSVIYGVVPFWKDNLITNITVTSYKEPFNRPIPHPSVFIPRNVYKKNGVYDINYKILADQELLLRLYKNNVSFKFIPKVLANFRLGGTSSLFKKLCNEERSRILKKYNFNCEMKLDPDKNYEIAYLWKKTFDKIEKYNNIYIYGIGKHTEKLLEYMPKKIKDNVKGLIDNNNNNNKVYGYYIYNINEIANYADAILISSLTYENDIYKRINEISDELDIIRIYGANTIEEVNYIVKDAVIL